MNLKKASRKYLAIITAIMVPIMIGAIFIKPVMVVGISMEPTYKDKDMVLLFRYPKEFYPGDIVAFELPVVYQDRDQPRHAIKRVIETREGELFLHGDNTVQSYGSDDFGWIKHEDVIGKVILPRQKFRDPLERVSP